MTTETPPDDWVLLEAINAELSQLIRTMWRHKRSNGTNSSDMAK
jgi:hypothetical protein